MYQSAVLNPFRPFVPEEACDAAALLAAVPESAQARGFLFDVVRPAFVGARAADIKLPSIPFQFYPQRDYLEALRAGALARYANRSLSVALFELGRSVYPTFAHNLIGRAIFAIGGRDYARVSSLAPRAYAAGSALARVTMRECRTGLVHAELRGAWDFVPYTCGVWRGAMDVCCVEPRRFDIRTHSLDHIELRIQW
jgi:uncharacterized protein (TIGR02265 family)